MDNERFEGDSVAEDNAYQAALDSVKAPKVYLGKTGAWTISGKVGGLYEVKLYSPAGALIDKVRCDDYRTAMEYRRSFNLIAKNHS